MDIETVTENEGIKYWLNEIDEAFKRDKEYHKEGRRIQGIYDCKDTGKVPFNILYSNTDTILPALYSATPRPVIRQRYKNEDATAQAAATAGERLLTYLLDTNTDGYETFDDGMTNAVIDALLPGRGVTRIKYDAEISSYDAETTDSGRNDQEVETPDSEEHADAYGPDREDGLQKESELVCIDSICWDKVLFGYAKKWSKVPWVAFEEIIDKDEAIRLFGKKIANKIKFIKEGDDEDTSANKDDHQGGRKTATIYQIWDKDGGRKVRYVSRHYKDDYLKVDDDPLELSGFYPMPKPLALIAKSNDMEITPPYSVYEEQARELNEVTRRRTYVLKAIRAKGLYDSELGGDIKNLMSGEENTLIPADKSDILSEQGFEKSIWFMPIEQLIKVYMELTNAQASIKQIIYEITGISDIIRGATVASETLGAQQLKSQWGTMRLKRNQKETQRYARDKLRLMLEIAATKFSEKTWVAMTGLEYATEQQIQQAQMVMKAAQQYQQQLAMQPPQIGPDGQPQQPQIPQQAMQAFQQAQQTLQQPQWSAVLDLLKNDMQRSYRIDIETNSTVIPEATEDKQNMSEALVALSGFMEKSLPAVQMGFLPFDGFKSILLKISKQFQFGDEIQDDLKGMQAPPPPQTPPLPPDNSLQIKQMELQAKQASDQAKLQAEMAKLADAKEIEQGKAMLQVNIEKMKKQDVQGQAMLDVQLEKMRLENEKYLETIRLIQEKELTHYKVDVEAQTKLQLATIAAQAQEAQAVEKETCNDDSIENDAIERMIEINAQMMKTMNAPKKILRGADGNIEGVESINGTKRVIRDENNNIIGVE